ncbi:MAG: inositol monophosphatase family protein [Phycisphaerales bacterium]
MQFRHDGPGRIIKPDGSPVTLADFGAQALVVRELRRELGDPHIVGEESPGFLRSHEGGPAVEQVVLALEASGAWPGAEPGAVLEAIEGGAHRTDGGGDGFWTLDPIDGTRGFLRGEQYSVCLAYIRGGRPIVGAVACPNLSAEFDRPYSHPDPHGVICFGWQAGGAWTVPADAPGDSPRSVTRPPWRPGDRVRLTESVSSGHSNREAFTRLMEALVPPATPVRIDSQCKYVVVARGEADAYLRVPPRADHAENIWDHAPGALLLEETGCTVTDLRGRSLDFSKPKITGAFGIVGATPTLHAKLVQLAAELNIVPQ